MHYFEAIYFNVYNNFYSQLDANFFTALASHINICISTNSETVFAGQPFSLVCEIHQTKGLTSQQLNIEWLDSKGSPVTEGGSVAILGPVRSGTRTTLTLEFDPLHLVHSEEYSCYAMLTTPAPPTQFEREARLEVIVMGMC